VEGQLIDFIKLPITQYNLDIVNKFLNTEHKISFEKTSYKMSNFDRLMIQVDWVKRLNDLIPIALERIASEAKQVYEERSELEKKVHMVSNKAEVGEELDAKDKRLEDLFGWQTQIESLQKNQIAFFLKDIAESPANWVVKEEYEAIGVVSRIEFQPIRVNKYAHEYYFRLGEVNIIMSATVLDYTRMASDLGLKLEETEFIDIPPQFPKENHKIFNLAWSDFGYSKTETAAEETAFYQEVVRKIDVIIDLFPDCRGIIHATSYPVAAYIKKFSKHADGRLTFHGAKDRAQKLELHKEKKGSVLVSPSMTEGVDLKDDLSRFQILIKVPFPDMSDDRIKRRMEVDPNSYPYLTAKTIIQSIGRSVRSEKDYAITFCLDSRMRGFTYMNKGMMEFYSRHVQSIENLKGLSRLQGKTELVKELRSPVSRPKKEAEKAQKKAAYAKKY
jgi:Rad3-related DNA helicase